MFGKRLTTFLLILSLVFPTFYLPVFASRAHALWGVMDFSFTVDVKALARQIADGIAMILAQKMIDSMVTSTINWAQSGFEGNPAYVTNPKQYFTNLSDNIAGEFILGSDLGFLCSPFQTQIRLALQRQYIREPYFQCSLTEVVGNIDAFYNDFSQGGWDGWFVMTQNNVNNPYGAYLEAQLALDQRIASAVGLQQQQLDWNQGFLSWSDCIREDPDTGECLERGPTQTPGTTIKAGLDKILPSPIEKLINVNHVEQLISAFATGLLQRYVFGPRGLFAGGGYTPPTSTIPVSSSTEGAFDFDNDGIADGVDSNGDGEIDICYFGGVDETTGPPCEWSSVFVTSGGGGGGSSGNPALLCQGVTQAGVMSILQNYPSNSAGLQQALPALRSAFGSQVYVFGSPGDFIDRINFGGGMIVDVIVDASGSNPSWGWSVNSPCSSSSGGGGGGGTCADPGNTTANYGDVINSAEGTVLSNNPTLASGLNNTANSESFVSLLISQLNSMGYQAGSVLNGNGNASSDHLVGIRQSGDNVVERYEVVNHAGDGDMTIQNAAIAEYSGDLPLSCAP